MKTLSMIIAILCGTLSLLAQTVTTQNTIESMPAVVVKTEPESGAKDVPPGVTEIKVTFSKAMADNSWSWATAWANSSPQMIGKPHYDSDAKTCVVRVKLEPGKTYAYWLNSQKFQGFRDKEGHAAVPYLLIFETTKK